MNASKHTSWIISVSSFICTVCFDVVCVHMAIWQTGVVYCFVHADHLTWYKSSAACVRGADISGINDFFSHISHHEGVFLQPEGLVYIYFIGGCCWFSFFFWFVLGFFCNGCAELNAVTS